MTRREFARRFGWDIFRMRDDFEREYSGSCWYCGTAYRTMGHGLADLTLDIVNPTKEPYYRTNTRLCCRTCNREKSNRPSELWERFRQEWVRDREWQSELGTNQCRGLPLFDHAAGVDRWDAPSHLPRKRCRRCGRLCDLEAFFRKEPMSAARRVYTPSRATCIACMQRNHHERVRQDRFLEKCRSTLGFHARRYPDNHGDDRRQGCLPT
jgi:hypothetical protein